MILSVDSRLIPAGVGVTLVSVYLIGIVEWISRPGLFPSSLLEIVVFFSILVRVLAIVVIPSLRRRGTAIAVILLGSEFLLYMGSVVVGALVSATWLLEIDLSFLAAWIGSAVILIPAAATYLIVDKFRTRERVVNAVPSAAGFFTVLAFIAGNVIAGAQTGGLAGVTNSLLVGLRGGNGPVVQNPLVLPLTAVLFSSLAVYAAVARRAGQMGSYRPSIIVVVSVVGVLGWALVSSLIQSPPVAMALPACSIAAMIWWFTRGP